MTIDEKVIYSPSSNETNLTVAQRKAWIESAFGYGISRAVTAFGVERFKKNVSKASLGFQMVLDAMYNEKTTETTTISSKINFQAFHPWLYKQILDRKKTFADQVAASRAKVPPVLAQASCRSI